MLKIRRSRERLIFNMGNPILVRWYLYMAPLVTQQCCWPSPSEYPSFNTSRVYVFAVRVHENFESYAPRPKDPQNYLNCRPWQSITSGDWLCLVPTSTTRFTSDVGYRIAKNLIGLYKENNAHEQWHPIPFPHKFWRPFLDCMPQVIFRPQYVWFLVHL